jgi:hypothetical protein
MDMSLTNHQFGDRNDYEVMWSRMRLMHGSRRRQQARAEIMGRYHGSREWQILRQRCRERAGDRCEYCRREPGTQLHHLTYLRLFREWLEDLLWICEECHEYLSARCHVDPRTLPECGNQLDLWREAA